MFIATSYVPLCHQWNSFNGVRNDEHYRNYRVSEENASVASGRKQRKNCEMDNYHGEITNYYGTLITKYGASLCYPWSFSFRANAGGVEISRLYYTRECDLIRVIKTIPWYSSRREGKREKEKERSFRNSNFL